MIARQWHGWTTHRNADAYQALLQERGPNVRHVAGRKGAYVLRRDLADEVEFIVLMLFESLEAVRAWAGEDYERARLVPGAEALLSRFDEKCTHYEIVDGPR